MLVVIAKSLGVRRVAARLVALWAAALVGLGLAAGSAAALTPTVTEFSAGVTASSAPSGIAAGPDGNLWFLEFNSPGRIGLVTTAGAVTEVATGGVTPGLRANAGLDEITAGPDGNLWFTEENNPGSIGRITPAGAVAEFSSGITPAGQPIGITAGPDGNLWFTEDANPGRIGRITTAGAVTEVATGGVTPGFSLNSTPTRITKGPDGNLWFIESVHPYQIGRITQAGAVTEIPGLSDAEPRHITAGPDGNLWFTGNITPGRIGRITTSGVVTEFTGGATPGFSSGDGPQGIAAGPDGNVWFTGHNPPGRVARITPTGAVSEFTGGITPGFSAAVGPDEIVTGPDGNIWFTEFDGHGAIARITTPPVAVSGAAVVLGSGAATVTGTVNGHAQPSSYRFEYGRTSAYGAASAPVSAGSGFADVSASARLSGLEPGTNYHYRLDVTNPTDTTAGADATFTTLALPRVGKVGIRPNRWRRGSRLPKISKKKKHARVGTKISFSLSRAVEVRLRFYRAKPGRKVKKKCRAPSRKNRRAKRCARLKLAGSISFSGRAGKNTVRFQGRISKNKKLKPGRYQLKVTATDPTTPKTSSRTANFTIVKG
jgi:streptogramin lyase